MNFREMRARLIASYGRFVFFPDNPEVPKIISTRAFTHLVLDDEITVYAQKPMEEQIEDELEENYNVIYAPPELKGEYFVSPYSDIETLNFKFKNGRDILKKAVRKPFDEEIEIIKDLNDRINEGLGAFWNEISIGMSESEVKSILECKLLKEGIDGFTYPTIVVSGKKSSYPIPRASNKKIEQGEIIYIDSSPQKDGYWLNFSRVIFAEERREWVDALEKINSMYHSISGIIKPGVKCNTLDEEIRKIGNFPHYSVVPSSGFYMPYAPGDCIIEENTIMSIVPSIYLGEGVIRVKRNVIVGKTKPEFLI